MEGDEPPGPLHRLEDEAADVVLDPGDAEGTAEQRLRGRPAAQLGELPRTRAGREVGEPDGELDEPAAEPLDGGRLAVLVGGAAEVGHPDRRRGAHRCAATPPSR